MTWWKLAAVIVAWWLARSAWRLFWWTVARLMGRG